MIWGGPSPPSHYSIVDGTPSPNIAQNLQVMSPRAPLGQDSALSANQHLQLQQHQHASAAAASAADLRADGSVVFKSLSQVIMPPDLISRLEALQRLELGQLADLGHVRRSVQGMADELFHRSELLGLCVMTAAEGSKENRQSALCSRKVYTRTRSWLRYPPSMLGRWAFLRSSKLA